MQVQERLSDGTGDFDEERMLQKLPKQLGLNDSQVKQAIEGLASTRKQNVLVQGIAHLRSRKLPEVIKDLNNLLACNKVRPHSFLASLHHGQSHHSQFVNDKHLDFDATPRCGCRLHGVATDTLFPKLIKLPQISALLQPACHQAEIPISDALATNRMAMTL